MLSFNSLVNSIILVCLLTIFDRPLETRTKPINDPLRDVQIATYKSSISMSTNIQITTYKFYTKVAQWAEARNICQSDGGDLAVINSKAEADLLVKLYGQGVWPVEGATFQNVAYIGMYEEPKKNWLTIHNKTLAEAGYEKWSELSDGQPDNKSDDEYCGGMMVDGTLDDIPCNFPFPFICEIPGNHTTVDWSYPTYSWPYPTYSWPLIIF